MSANPTVVYVGAPYRKGFTRRMVRSVKVVVRGETIAETVFDVPSGTADHCYVIESEKVTVC